MTTRQRLSHLIGPILLVVVGLILLFYNLGVISTSLWDTLIGLWPLLVIAVAAGMILEGGSLFFPLTLIALALGFLVANFDFVDWDMGDLLSKLWPLLLVAVGLDVLVVSRLRGVETHTEEILQPLGNATSADIKIESGIGRLQLGAGVTATALVSGAAVLGPNEHLKQTFNMHGSEARIKIKQDVPWNYFFTGGWLSERRWDLSLNTSVPTRIKIDGGIGDRTIDLRSLNLTQLKVDGGIGALTLTLPAQGRLQTKIDGGIGDKTILIPTGMAARIRIDSGLGHSQVRGNYTQQGSTYTSPNYEAAPHRVDLDIDHGIGSLTIAETAAAR